MISPDITNAVQQFVYTQSNGVVTEPVNGSWLQAYCEFLGVTQPVNGSWLQAPLYLRRYHCSIIWIMGNCFSRSLWYYSSIKRNLVVGTSLSAIRTTSINLGFNNVSMGEYNSKLGGIKFKLIKIIT